jgi:undecaprenyl-phosphate 4-deoxy-4-formamido-L-arabinose transferase
MSSSDAPLPPGISVVVPVYNSEKTVEILTSRLRAVLESTGRAFELVLVNDGSGDGSWQVIEGVCRDNDWVRGIDLMRNHGQENALLCGVRAARFDTTAILDDDLQNPPEELPRLLAALDGGLDVVYGRPERERHGLWRDAASMVTKFVLQETLGARKARQVSPYKIFRTQLRDAFAEYRSPHVSIDVLLTWGTERFGSIIVKHDPRAIGRSNFSFRKLVTHAVNLVTGFSIVPLQLASIMGFAFALFGFGVLVYVLIDYFVRGDPVPGFPFLAAIVSILSGAQMFALGIIGEYIARIHVRSMERRPYTIRRSIGGESQ